MFRVMRNIHLILGLLFFSYAILFAASSLVIIYRPWLKVTRSDQEQIVRVASDRAQTPRDVAFELMQNHQLRGDLQDIKYDAGTMQFLIVRPGTRSDVTYTASTGEAKIRTRREGFLETLVQLHTNHGFWHTFAPANVWSLLSLLGSIGLFLLGATGIYLWFCHHEERVIGFVILSLGLAYSLATLVLSRMA
jgi:hypothetical protein